MAIGGCTSGFLRTSIGIFLETPFPFAAPGLTLAAHRRSGFNAYDPL